MNDDRTHILEFGKLWKMAIDVPYSTLVGKGVNAWSCGQLALSRAAQVLASGDLKAQAEIVCTYLEQILLASDLDVTNVRRIVVYFVRTGSTDDRVLQELFAARFGVHTMVDLIPLPRFYYDGIELECDLFCGAPVTHAEQESSATHRFDLCMTARDAWLSIASDATALADTLSALRVFLARFDFDSSNVLAEHWMASTEDLPAAISMPGLGEGFDALAIVNAGAAPGPVRGRFRLLRDVPVSGSVTHCDDSVLVVRQAPAEAWLQVRPAGSATGLVDGTRVSMARMAEQLSEMNLQFADVVKQTAHYVGASAEELHANMRVRNACYTQPGPASTGVPVYGLAAGEAKSVIDLHLVPGWRA